MWSWATVDGKPEDSKLVLQTSNALTKKRKIAVLGSRSVGKSSLVGRFIDNNFTESYFPTIEATLSKSVMYKGVAYDCDIIDSAGQDEYTPVKLEHAVGIHGYVLVYSISAEKSFKMVQLAYDKIVDFWGVPKIPCVIVGSKCDLPKAERQVLSEHGKQLAKDMDCAWIETSAKENINVAEVFELCLQEIERNTAPNQEEPELPTRCILQ